MWQTVKSAIQQNSKFLLCTHRNPDADGIGSELALRAALAEMGKSAVILNPDSLPPILQFMDPEGVIKGFDSLSLEESRHLLEEAEVIFFLDACILQRFHRLGDELAGMTEKVICIDHHPAEKSLTSRSVVRAEASSTGELIYELLKELEHPLNERTAFWIYCAIVKDTGSFRFENTNEKVFRIAADLSRFGIAPNEVYDQLFERSSINSVACLGRVLNTLRFAYDNRLAYIYLTLAMLEETGAEDAESDNFVNVIRSIDPVRVCLFFHELGDDKVRVSFRSKSAQIDVNELAGQFGGGGHVRASGAVIDGPLEEVIRKVVDGARVFFD